MNKDIVKIYHGSEAIIKEPLYGKGSTKNDYGRGFYCTQEIELAKEWACSRSSDGYANIYDLDLFGLNILKLNDTPYNVLHWLAILADNRTYWERNSISEEAKNYLKKNYLIDINSFDLIIGYRADDSYFTFIKNFVSGTISLAQLEHAMKLGILGEQIVLKSEQAFKQISWVDSEISPASTYFAKKSRRDKDAQLQYRKQVHNKAEPDSTYIIDIIRKGYSDENESLL